MDGYTSMHIMKILIDNGHGQFTPGKRSPDGNFREATVPAWCKHWLENYESGGEFDWGKEFNF